MVDAVQLSIKVLNRLTTIGYEKKCLVSTGQLIFPSKKDLHRISEQELRQLFIEEFKNEYEKLYYSIEAPTVYKYSFTNELKQIKIGDETNIGQSALLDMCVFEKGKELYKRLLNIEFKHKNATEANISKDVLKLMHEEQNGAFILLLKNTDSGTLKSVFSKFSNSIETHKKQWKGEKDKFIELIILSLEEKKDEKGTPFLIHRKITKGDNLEDAFSFDGRLTNIDEVKRNGWEIEHIEKVSVGDVAEELDMVVKERASYGE